MFDISSFGCDLRQRVDNPRVISSFWVLFPEGANFFGSLWLFNMGSVSLVNHAVFRKENFFNIYVIFDEFMELEKITAPLKYVGILTPFGIYYIGCIIRHLKHVSVHGDTRRKIGPTLAFLLFLGYFSYLIIANCTGLIMSQVVETFSRFFFHHCSTFFC